MGACWDVVLNKRETVGFSFKLFLTSRAEIEFQTWRQASFIWRTKIVSGINHVGWTRAFCQLQADECCCSSDGSGGIAGRPSTASLLTLQPTAVRNHPSSFWVKYSLHPSGSSCRHRALILCFDTKWQPTIWRAVAGTGGVVFGPAFNGLCI